MAETTFPKASLTSDSQPSYVHYSVDINDINQYTFMTHTYEGTGGYKDCSYLIPFHREAWYENRKKFSVYRNFLKPIIDALVMPVFSNPITREYDSALFDEFVINANNKGDSLTAITMEACKYARLHGVCFVVMDNFSEVPELLQDAIDLRAFPYIYIQTADTVSEYAVDRFGKLESITFKGVETLDGKELTTLVTWTKDDYIKEWVYKNTVVKTESVVHGLGVLPVTAVFSENVSDVLPNPPFYSIARLNYGLFNKDSELRDQERAQAFSILYYQTNGNNNNITIGPHNVIPLPVSNELTITPGYASPDSSVIKALIESSEKYIKSIHDAAEQRGVTVTATSGIEQAYKFRSTAQQLKNTARVAMELEVSLAKLFMSYTNSEFEITVSYTKEYSPYYEQLSVDDATKMLQIDYPVEVKNEIKKVLVGKVLNHLNSDEMRNLTDLINESSRETTQS